MPPGDFRHTQDILLPSLHQLLISSTPISDVTLICDDGPVHSFQPLLASCSSLFRDLLSMHDLEDVTVILPDIEKSSVDDLHRALLCSDVYPDTSDLLDHLFIDFYSVPNRNLPVDKSCKKLLECPVCMRSYTSEQNYRRHLESHKSKEKENKHPRSTRGRPKRSAKRPKRFSPEKDPTNLTCYDCDINFETLTDLEKHETSHQRTSAKPKPHHFYCEECQKSFSSKQVLNNHKLLHKNERKFGCEECGKKFVTPFALSTHQKLHQGKTEKFPCDHCGKTLNSASNLLRHLRSVHFEMSDQRVFTCDTCGKDFKDPSGLAAHKKTHVGVKNHECDVCQKRFLMPGQLRVHLRTHQNERDFQCDECLKRFTTKYQLQSHQQRKHSMSTSTPKSSFLCQTCGEIFAKSSDLTEHSRKHSGEMPFACDICLKAFKSKRMLKSHEKTVHGSNHECQTCSKRFNTPGNLAKHLEYSPSCTILTTSVNPVQSNATPMMLTATPDPEINHPTICIQPTMSKSQDLDGQMILVNPQNISWDVEPPIKLGVAPSEVGVAPSEVGVVQEDVSGMMGQDVPSQFTFDTRFLKLAQ